MPELELDTVFEGGQSEEDLSSENPTSSQPPTSDHEPEDIVVEPAQKNTTIVPTIIPQHSVMFAI